MVAPLSVAPAGHAFLNHALSCVFNTESNFQTKRPCGSLDLRRPSETVNKSTFDSTSTHIGGINASPTFLFIRRARGLASASTVVRRRRLDADGTILAIPHRWQFAVKLQIATTCRQLVSPPADLVGYKCVHFRRALQASAALTMIETSWESCVNSEKMMTMWIQY